MRQAPRLSAIVLLLMAASVGRAEEHVFVGYLFGAPRALNYRLYTHLCHAFVVADEDGRVRPSANAPSKEVTTAAHEKGVKVLLSLGGWGWDKQFAAICSKPEAEDRYVAAILKMVDEFAYDGIDLDWEYPDTREEVVGFERLTRRFRKGLDDLGMKRGMRLELTMAASSNPGTLKWLDTAFLVETMDWINLMTYDMAGEWTPYAGHHAPLFASSKVPGGQAPSVERSVRYLLEERKLPANRIALGIPLYGKGFPVGEPYASTKDVAKKRLPRGDFANLNRLREEEGWKLLRDDETKTPWLIAPDKSAVIGHDDAESVALKTRWALEKGLRGVFFWQVNGDRLPDGSNLLQDVSRLTLDQVRAGQP